jgi:hypothetical protein
LPQVKHWAASFGIDRRMAVEYSMWGIQHVTGSL